METIEHEQYYSTQMGYYVCMYVHVYAQPKFSNESLEWACSPKIILCKKILAENLLDEKSESWYIDIYWYMKMMYLFHNLFKSFHNLVNQDVDHQGTSCWSLFSSHKNFHDIFCLQLKLGNYILNYGDLIVYISLSTCARRLLIMDETIFSQSSFILGGHLTEKMKSHIWKNMMPILRMKVDLK